MGNPDHSESDTSTPLSGNLNHSEETATGWVSPPTQLFHSALRSNWSLWDLIGLLWGLIGPLRSEIWLVVWLVRSKISLALSASFQLRGWPANNSSKGEEIIKAVIGLRNVTLHIPIKINLLAQSMATRRQWNQDETEKMTVGSTLTSRAPRSEWVGEF